MFRKRKVVLRAGVNTLRDKLHFTKGDETLSKVKCLLKFGYAQTFLSQMLQNNFCQPCQTLSGCLALLFVQGVWFWGFSTAQAKGEG